MNLRTISTGFLFKLASTFEKEIVFKGQKTKVIIPKGFKTDLTSVPRIFWSIIPPFGTYQEAALIHDCLYKNKGIIKGINKQLTRKESDEIFYQIMLQDNTKKIRAKIIFWAVRMFGWKYFGKTKEEQKDNQKELDYEK